MIKSISDWFSLCRENGAYGIVPALVFKDGFSISVQAGDYNYCEPRKNNLTKYESYELGFPSVSDDLIIEYAADLEKPTDTVYPMVPSQVVDELINKHGGFHFIKISKRLDSYILKRAYEKNLGRDLQIALKKQIVLENLLNV